MNLKVFRLSFYYHFLSFFTLFIFSIYNLNKEEISHRIKNLFVTQLFMPDQTSGLDNKMSSSLVGEITCRSDIKIYECASETTCEFGANNSPDMTKKMKKKIRKKFLKKMVLG